MLKGFLRRVWGESEGWVFVAFGKGEFFKQRAFKYPGQLELVVNELKQQNTWTDVYFCPHTFTDSKRLKTHAKKSYALWIDYDRSGPEKIDPKPTICWRTSANRHQALWILQEPAEPEEAEKVNRALTYSCGGDKGGWALTKIIRPPESINYKYDPPQDGMLLWDDGPVYQNAETVLEFLKQKEEQIPPDTEELKKKAEDITQQTEMPEELPELSDVLKEHGRSIPQAGWDLLEQQPEQDEDWSDNLWKLERLLVEAGLPLEAVFVVVANSPWNKYKRDGRPPEQLWREVLKAYEERTSVTEEQQGLPWTGMNKLLLYSEKPEWLVDGIWMDKNVGWIAGVGKSYKSVLSLDLAVSIATGKPFLNTFEVLKPGPVLMIQEEDPVWRVAHRLQLICAQKGINIPTLTLGEGNMELEIPKSRDIPLLLSVGGGFNFVCDDMIKNIEKAIEYYKPRMIVFDPFFMLAPGVDEYKAGETTKILNLMKYWRNTYDCAIAVVHHYNKSKDGNNSSKLYGTMAFYAWAENNMFVERAPGNVISVKRDIKDAIENDEILVRFDDLEQELSYNVELKEDMEETQAMQTGGEKPKDRILNYLANYSPGTKVPRKKIMEATGIGGKTVSKVLTELENKGIGKVTNEGQGGAAVFILFEIINQFKSGGVSLDEIQFTM